MQDHHHVSVLKTEAIEALQLQPKKWYIDATFGRGGHTRVMLDNGANVLAIDCDQAAIEFGQETFAQEIADGSLILVRSNFDLITKVWTESKPLHGQTHAAGVLFDFGVSSPQLSTPERGFSFQTDGPLDMRMDNNLGVQAKDMLAVLSEKQLADTFYVYGGEVHSRKLAKLIVAARKRKPFTRTRELADFIEQHQPRTGHLHPATKVFQALRIVVNSELQSIETGLPQALEILDEGGRVVTISFHEGEDRIVKHVFHACEEKNEGKQLDKKAVTPSNGELIENPRARSAKLRIFERKTTENI